jgi:hypothetical protein
MEILHDVYKEFTLENVKFSKFSDIIKLLTRDDTHPLYKGFNIDQFR